LVLPLCGNLPGICGSVGAVSSLNKLRSPFDERWVNGSMLVKRSAGGRSAVLTHLGATEGQVSYRNAQMEGKP
jgi:hypothetical protein